MAGRTKFIADNINNILEFLDGFKITNNDDLSSGTILEIRGKGYNGIRIVDNNLTGGPVNFFGDTNNNYIWVKSNMGGMVIRQAYAGLEIDCSNAGGLTLNGSSGGGIEAKINNSGGFRVYGNLAGNSNAGVWLYLNPTGHACGGFNAYLNGGGFNVYCEVYAQIDLHLDGTCSNPIYIRNDGSNTILIGTGGTVNTNEIQMYTRVSSIKIRAGYDWGMGNLEGSRSVQIQAVDGIHLTNWNYGGSATVSNPIYIENQATVGGGVYILNYNSGSIEIKNINTDGGIVIRSDGRTSGSESISIENNNAGKIYIHSTASTSGGIRLHNENNGNIEIHNSSGTIELRIVPTGSSIVISSSISLNPYMSFTEINAGVRYSVAIVTSTPTTIPRYAHIAIFDTDTAGSNITVFLISAATATGQYYQLKNKGATYNVIVTPDGTDKIENASDHTLAPGESIQIVCDGTGWWIV